MKPKRPNWLRQAQDAWTFRGQNRPPFAIEPAEGQESVWDYPRPPAVVQDSRTIVVKDGAVVLAETTSAIRICETASPPAFYIPPQDVDLGLLTLAAGSSFCEWKGPARYWHLAGAETPTEAIGWDYPTPLTEFEALAGFLSFYPGRIDCFVEGERVLPQAGGFYGGWITPDIVGPFKGDPGTGGW